MQIGGRRDDLVVVSLFSFFLGLPYDINFAELDSPCKPRPCDHNIADSLEKGEG